MISNEERREVAAKLRETEPFEYGGEKWYDEGKILDALDLSFDNVPSIYDPEKVKRLADLIDRPTCRKVIPSEMEGYVFCSNCGAEIGEYGVPNYCHNCGAEVVE